MTTEEGNIILVKFDLHISTSELEYHNSWNRLMPVIEKFLALPIEQFNHDVENMGRLRAFKNAIRELSITTKIHAVWHDMAEYCEWYLQTKNKQK